MISKLKIIFWFLKNKYYLHLCYMTIFYINKKINKKIKYYETRSSHKAKLKCIKLKIEKEKLYVALSKIIGIKSHKVRKFTHRRNLLLKGNYKLGGGSDIQLIYNLILMLKPNKILEFGVANGWSTLSILEGCKKNNKGSLLSIDMPYFFKNAKFLIANLIKKKKIDNWKLIISPQINFLLKLNKEEYDFCHYDSDKTYQGRMLAYKKIWIALRKGGILISDDISDNLAFFNFTKTVKTKTYIVKYKNKFLGIAIK
jgi:predicted O-methyltransferase YrrM